jgi:hypothetical protein
MNIWWYTLAIDTRRNKIMEIINIKIPFTYTPITHSYKGWALHSKEFYENVEPFIIKEFWSIFRRYALEYKDIGRSPMYVDKLANKWVYEIHTKKNIVNSSFSQTYDVDEVLCKVVFEIEKVVVTKKEI